MSYTFDISNDNAIRLDQSLKYQRFEDLDLRKLQSVANKQFL